MGSYLAEAIRESGLVSAGDRGVAMVSGGADSVALLTGLAELLGPGRLIALHVNYGLRPEAGEDEVLVRRLCERRGVECEVHRAGRPEGNVQAWAREIRHREAERIRAERSLDWIAVGHNRSDLVETFLYRLISSPGARSLLAMPPRSGQVIRPLLALDRRQIRSELDGVEQYAEDASNDDPAYARNRIRLEAMPALEQVNPAAERNVARTRDELEEDEDALMELAREAVSGQAGGLAEGLGTELLAARHPAVARRMIRHLAESALGRPVAVSRELAADAIRLAAGPEGGRLDLGGGDQLLIEAGKVRVVAGPEEPAPGQVEVGVGFTAFGAWGIEASWVEESEARRGFGDPWTAFLEPRGQVPRLRARRHGDRIEPLGMRGSKKLQDVFTDARVPASQRRSWPILTVDDTVIWVPGLVRSRHCLIGDAGRKALQLHATPPASGPGA